MKIRKTFYIVLLTALCFALMIVSAIPMSDSSESNTYDPILDINHDGTIDMRDLGMTAKAFNPLVTGQDPTVPVNVTNWLSPESTVLWCGNYSIQSQSYTVSTNPIGSIPVIDVSGYDRMTVILNFSISSYSYDQQGKCSYVSTKAYWYLSPSDSSYSSDSLTSTLYQIDGDVQGGWVGSAYCISTDSYPIKGPYVSLGPYLESMAASRFNATLSIFISVSHGPTLSSLRKTMMWNDWDLSLHCQKPILTMISACSTYRDSIA